MRKGFIFYVFVFFFLNSLFSLNSSNSKNNLILGQDSMEVIFRRGGRNRKRAAIILGKIAKLAHYVANLVSGSKEGRKENVAAIALTSCEAIEELSNVRVLDLESESCRELGIEVEDIVETLYSMLLCGKDKILVLEAFPLLQELSTIVTYAERSSWFIKRILANDLVQKLIHEALAYARTYLHKKVDGIIDSLSDFLLAYRDICNFEDLFCLNEQGKT